jgi:peroxiredoxin
LKLPFPVLSDPEREVYRIYELEKYLLLIQRTASIVVDRNGIVQYIKRTTNPITGCKRAATSLGLWTA